jgi:hypothetical protein
MSSLLRTAEREYAADAERLARTAQAALVPTAAVTTRSSARDEIERMRARTARARRARREFGARR